jgi:hypothetical protein
MVYAARGDEEGKLERPFPASQAERPTRVTFCGRMGVAKVLRFYDIPCDYAFPMENEALIALRPGRYLVCRYGPPSSSASFVSLAGRGVLEEFCELANAEDNRVKDYAKRWGPLGVCPHGNPEQWTSEHYEHSGGHKACPLSNNCYQYRIYPEPLSAWRHYARLASAILRLTSDLEDGQPGSPEAWAVLDQLAVIPRAWEKAKYEAPIGADGTPDFDEEYFIEPEKIGPYVDWKLINGTVNRWLREAGVRPVVWRDSEDFTIRYGSGSLLGALGVQLMMALSPTAWKSRFGGIASCAHCGQFFQPGKRLRRHQNNYCPTCRADPEVTRTRQAVASRAYRERKHSGRD